MRVREGCGFQVREREERKKGTKGDTVERGREKEERVCSGV